MSKALLLDRDGVINIDHGYTVEIGKFEFMPGIFELVASARQKGFRVIVVTNQSGIGRGYYTEQQFQILSEWMKARFAERGCPIDAIYHCPHHPEKALGPYLQACDCRKPAPGMLLAAQEDFAVNMAESVMIGDKLSDMQAAAKAGVGRRVLFSDSTNQPLSMGEATEAVADLTQIRL